MWFLFLILWFILHSFQARDVCHGCSKKVTIFISTFPFFLCSDRSWSRPALSEYHGYYGSKQMSHFSGLGHFFCNEVCIFDIWVCWKHPFKSSTIYLSNIKRSWISNELNECWGCWLVLVVCIIGMCFFLHQHLCFCFFPCSGMSVGLWERMSMVDLHILSMSADKSPNKCIQCLAENRSVVFLLFLFFCHNFLRASVSWHPCLTLTLTNTDRAV